MHIEPNFHPLTLEQLNMLIQRSTMPQFAIDQQGLICCCNDEFEFRSGYSAAELIGHRLDRVYGGDKQPQALQSDYWEALQSRNELPLLQFAPKHGSPLHVSYSVQPVPIDDGRIVMVVVIHDLEPSAGLSLLQRFSDSFMRDVNLGVILIDTSFRLVDISDTACRVLGFKREEVVQHSMEEVFLSVPLDHQLVQRTILDGLTVRNHAFSWTNDDQRYELIMDSNILKDGRGRIAGAYVIFKDVSNLRSLEEQVQRSDRLAMIGQIAAGTAHEIRNPLTSIKGFLQVLKKSFQNNSMDKEISYTEIMLTEIDRINELVSEFLLLSKPKNVSYEPIEIPMVLREIMPIINNEAILHGISVEYEPIMIVPKVIGDRELLKQVCLNISKNGIEAMTEGGTLTITERVDSEERKVHIDIHDTGPGIPAFLIDKIFDPFFTTKEYGTGLGLSVCQRIIHDLGGTIRVSSKGFGTTFTISIPC